MLEKKLKDILNSRHLSIEEFAAMCDLPVETVKNIYYGRTIDPKVSTVMKISKALDITVNCLMGHCTHSDEEKVLLQHFRSCGNHGKSMITLTAKYEALAAKDERASSSKHVISCIIPQNDIREGIDYSKCKIVEIKTSHKDAYLGIKITNNDLVPIYCKDDIILIQNCFPRPNELGVFYKDGKFYIRKYLEEANRQYRLQCLHPMGKDMIYSRMDQIEYIGTCCGTIRA